MNEEARTKLWEEYEKNSSPQIREKLIIEYSPLVKIVAGRLSMYLGNNVEYDDLVGYGIFGLIDAIDKFSLCKGVKFETYASLRIRGSILDQIRKMDWIPRTVRQKQKLLENAMKKLEAENGRIPTDEELALEMNISQEELSSIQDQTKLSNIVSLDEFMEQGSEVKFDVSKNNTGIGQPEKEILKSEIKDLLISSLDKLTEKEKKVILLYYYEELTLKEISLIVEVSESRVSQLHTRALGKMKTCLGEYSDILNII